MRGKGTQDPENREQKTGIRIVCFLFSGTWVPFPSYHFVVLGRE